MAMQRSVAESSIAGFAAALYGAYVVPAVICVATVATVAAWSNPAPRFDFLIVALIFIGMPTVFVVAHWLLMRGRVEGPWRWGTCTAAGLFMGLAAATFGGGFLRYYFDELFWRLLPHELTRVEIVAEFSAVDIATAVIAAVIGSIVLGAMQAIALKTTRGNRVRWIAVTVGGVVAASVAVIVMAEFAVELDRSIRQALPLGWLASTSVVGALAIAVLGLPFAAITGRSLVVMHRREERVRAAAVVDTFA